MKKLKLITNNYNLDRIKHISKKFNISEIVSKVLLNRGLSDDKLIGEFLSPKMDLLETCSNFKDMIKGTERLIKAIENNENIMIYGDYDVDGVTSISQFIILLKEFNINVQYYIPDRETEGYGISNKFLSIFKNSGYDLLITVDCGISNYNELNEISEYGIDTIIIDHHQCPEIIPKAYAVINPKQEDCKSINKNLCAAGITFKFLRYICKHYNMYSTEQKLLELACLGTVADIVELRNDNRIIVYNGLELIKNTKNIGLKKIIENASIVSSEIDTYHISYLIAPRINAAGRMSHAEKAVELLTTSSVKKADSLSMYIDLQNQKRKNEELKIVKEAVAIIENKNLKEKKIIVVSGENWNEGVIGIAASRLTNKYGKPAIVISVKNGVGKSSARSLEYFDIYKAIKETSSLLDKFGGHKLAAGLTIKEENILQFSEKINNYADSVITEDDLIKKISIDDYINVKDIDDKLFKELETLAPYGCGNSRPQFGVKDFVINNITKVGKEGNHIKLFISDEDCKIKVMAFNKINILENLIINPEVLVVNISQNKYKGKVEILLLLQEVKNSFSQDFSCELDINKKEAIKKTISNTNSEIVKTDIFTLVEKINKIYNVNITLIEAVNIIREMSKVNSLAYKIKDNNLYIKKLS